LHNPILDFSRKIRESGKGFNSLLIMLRNSIILVV
jgi:hypothetical protein